MGARIVATNSSTIFLLIRHLTRHIGGGKGYVINVPFSVNLVLLIISILLIIATLCLIIKMLTEL